MCEATWPLKHPTGKVSYSNRLQLPVSAVKGGEVEVFSGAVHSTNYTSFKCCDSMLLDDPDLSLTEQFLLSKKFFCRPVLLSHFDSKTPNCNILAELLYNLLLGETGNDDIRKLINHDSFSDFRNIVADRFFFFAVVYIYIYGYIIQLL